MTFALAFAGAVFAAVYVLPLRWLLPAAAVCALGGALSLCFRGDGRTRALLLALGMAAGLLWCRGYEALRVAPARALDGASGTFRAAVETYPQTTRYGRSMQVALETEGGAIRTILYAPEGEDLRPGDELTFEAELRVANVLREEDTRYYFARGVYLLAYCRGEVSVSRPARIPLRYVPAALAQRLRGSIRALFPEEAAGLLCAMTTGERSGVSEDFSAALKRSGLAHVVAVSGMHLVFLVGMVSALTGRAHRRRSAVVAIPAVLLFMAMTGFPASVVRAGVMQVLVLLSLLTGRERDTLTSLSLALFLLLAWNPNSAADVGLQLSFAATAGIMLFASPIGEALDRKLRLDKPLPGIREPLRRLGRFFTGTLATTLGALIFTAPISAWYFGTVCLIAPVSNLLCLWAVSFAFMLGLPAGLLGLIWLPLGKVLAAAAMVPVRYLLTLVPALARLPFASIPVAGRPYLWLWLGFVYLAALCAFLRRGEKGHVALPALACAVTLAAALLCSHLTFTGGDLTVSVLDVGQGLCVVLHSAGKTVIVDCGGNTRNAGDIAADYVQSLGSTQVDLLVLTHYHADHANGVPELLRRLDVGMLALPDVEEEEPLRHEILALAEEEGIEAFLLEENADVTFGEASARIYAPLGAGDTNEEGLSVLATCGDFDVLITGDMGSAVEKRLVKYGALPDIELLVVGHHGSRYSSSEELLRAARPEYAVISVGYNSYGHPADETLERLGAAGCEIYRTDRMGTVRIRADWGGG